MAWQVQVFAVVYGLAAAWVAQLLIERVPMGESLRGPLRCPTCAAPLPLAARFPLLSWIVRRRRCHACGVALGMRQAGLELICVLLSLEVLSAPLPGLTVMPWLLFVPIGVALAFIDLGHKRLPDALTLPAAAGALVLLAIDAVLHGLPGLAHAVVGAIALFLLYLLMNLLSRGGMGMGDVKLALSIGALTGYLGWVYSTGATMIAFLIGGVVSAVLLASRRTDRKATIPFGPFMIVGAFASLPIADFLASYLVA